MKYYTCDVCGEPMPSSYERGSFHGFRASFACGVNDVCPTCEQIGHRINVADVVLKAWRNGVVNSKENVGEDGRPNNKPKYAGHGGREKVEIYERLAAYRGTPPKLGVLTAVSALTGGEVSADDLRSILNGSISLPIDKWRLIAKALDELEGGTDG